MDVVYKYDSQGRMLTRVSGGVTTKFTWDGWDLVKEDDGTNVIRYYCPQGELFSIERSSEDGKDSCKNLRRIGQP